MSISPPSKRGIRSPARRRAVALVITLMLLVIVTILVVLFVTATRQDRAASFHYGQSLQAEQIGLGALNLVIGELQKEMSKDAAPDTKGGLYPNYPVFTNVTSANILPEKVGTNASMPNLLKI